MGGHMADILPAVHRVSISHPKVNPLCREITRPPNTMFIVHCLALALALSTEVQAGVVHLPANDSSSSQSHPTGIPHAPRQPPPFLSSLLPLLPHPVPSRLPSRLSSLFSLHSSLHLPVPSPIRLPVPSSIHLPIPSSIHLPIPSPIRLPVLSSIRLPIPSSLPLPIPSPIRLPVPSFIRLPVPSSIHLPIPSSLPLPIPSPLPPSIPLSHSLPIFSSLHPTAVHKSPSLITTILPSITTPTPVDPPHTDSPQVNPPHTDSPHANPPHTDPPQVNPPHTDSPNPSISETSPRLLYPSALHSPVSLKVSATIHVQTGVSPMTQPNTKIFSPTSSLSVFDTATTSSSSGPGPLPPHGTTTTPSTSSIQPIHHIPTPPPTFSSKPHMVHVIGGAIGGSLLLLTSLLLVFLLLRRRRQRALEVRGGHTALEAPHQPQLPLVARILRSIHIGSTTTIVTPFHKPAFLRSSRGFTRIRDDDDDSSYHPTGSPSRGSAHVFSSQSVNVSASEIDSPQTTLVEAHGPGVNHGLRGKRLRNSYARNARAPSFFFRYRNYLSVQNPSSSQDLEGASTSSRPMTIGDQSTNSMVQTTSRGPPSLIFTSSDVAADTSTESGHLTTQWFTTSSDSMQSLSSGEPARASSRE